MRVYVLVFLLILSLTSKYCHSQNSFQDIDPKWDRYYDQNPSGIEEHYQASDFISVIDKVGFIPNRDLYKGDINYFKKLLLKLDIADLNQLKMTGNYYSRTLKHDDYFNLYNLTYKQVTKAIWDQYCPFLLPLMELDQTIKLHK